VFHFEITCAQTSHTLSIYQQVLYHCVLHCDHNISYRLRVIIQWHQSLSSPVRDYLHGDINHCHHLVSVIISQQHQLLCHDQDLAILHFQHTSGIHILEGIQTQWVNTSLVTTLSPGISPGIPHGSNILWPW